jgi:ATP-dependent RNA helicase SUPV3L1/SUV3
LAAPVEGLERLDALLRAAPKLGGGQVLSDQAREELGWSEADAGAVMRGLGFARAGKPKEGEPVAWRRRDLSAPKPAKPPVHSPFAALAALKTAPPRRRPRRKPKAAHA